MGPHVHVPERQCVACGRRAPKAALVRFVAVESDGTRHLALDRAGRLAGRGLYLCPSRACFAIAVKRRAFARAARLRGETIVIDDTLAEALD